MRTIGLISVAALVLLTGSTVLAATSATASFDYNTANGSFNKDKLLNLARGYKGPISNASWHNSFYGTMASIGVRELRMDWLPSDLTYHVISRNGSNQLVYDFTQLDAILLPLLKRGMRPVMCMHMEHVSALGITNGFPSNLNDYQAVIEAFVQHYKDLGYTGLTWESHNEPENFTTLTAEQTYIMYDYFAHGVKSVDPTALVGGHGTGSDWFSYMGSFLNYYAADTTRPAMDFFSYHQYMSETFSSVTQAEQLFTSRGLPVPPLYLTEWNDYPFVQEDNDNSHHAAWVAQKMHWALKHAPALTKIYFFNYADGDTSKVFSGDNGLLTAGNHKKASANTFNFFNQMHDVQLSSTITGTDTSSYYVHAIATKDSLSGAVSVILWNNRSTDVNVSLSLNNLPYLSASQNFVLTKYIIDETHGNYYNDYLANPSLSPTSSIVGDSENVGVAEITTLPPASSWSRTEYLPAWSVTQIKLDPVSIFDQNVDYTFMNGSSGLVMQINEVTQKAEQGAYDALDTQKWNLVDLGTGYFIIVNKDSGQVLEVPGGSVSNGTQLAQATWTGADHQQWQIVDEGSFYKLVNRNSGLAANVNGASQSEGAGIIQWTFGSQINAFWKIQAAGPAPFQTCRGQWMLDETTGTVAADASGFEKHGTLSGTTFNAASIPGKDGQALNLDGVDDHIILPALNLYSNTVTMTAWVKCDASPVPWSGIVFNRTPNANGLNIGNGSELRYHWNNGMYSWESGLSLPTNIWTFIALVIEPDQGTLYMDSGSGLQSATNNAVHDIESFNGDTYIGYDPAVSTRHFEGAVDDVRIYSKALTAAELEAVRNDADHDPPTPNPMTWDIPPYEIGMGEVTMTADTADDPAGVEYYFACVSGGGHDSGWQDSPTYTDTGLYTLTVEYHVKARDKSPNYNETDVSTPPASVTIARYPYGGTVRTIPNLIQVEEFDVAGEGVSYHDTTVGNSGGAFRPNEDVDIISFTENSTTYYAVDAIETGEWLEYTVHSTAGQADVSARVASTGTGGQIKVWLDTTLLATLAVPETGSLASWQNVSASGLTLPEQANAVLKLEFVGTGFRVDWVTFQQQGPYGAGSSPVPGVIEFEHYDIGGQGIAYYDTTPLNNMYTTYRQSEGVDIFLDTGTGQYAVYALQGEWLEYTCDIEPGLYTIVVNSGTPSVSPELTISDDQQVLAVMALPTTDNFYAWQDSQVTDVYIPGGDSAVLRLMMTNGNSVLNQMEFIRQYNVADINASGRVDLGDFVILASQWQNAPGTPSADIALPANDFVDLDDLRVMAQHWLVEQ